MITFVAFFFILYDISYIIYIYRLYLSKINVVLYILVFQNLACLASEHVLWRYCICCRRELPDDVRTDSARKLNEILASLRDPYEDEGEEAKAKKAAAAEKEGDGSPPPAAKAAAAAAAAAAGVGGGAEKTGGGRSAAAPLMGDVPSPREVDEDDYAAWIVEGTSSDIEEEPEQEEQEAAANVGGGGGDGVSSQGGGGGVAALPGQGLDVPRKQDLGSSRHALDDILARARDPYEEEGGTLDLQPAPRKRGGRRPAAVR